MGTRRKSSRKVDDNYSIESLNEEQKLKLLDMQPLKSACSEVEMIVGTGDQADPDEDSEDKKSIENFTTAKMNTFVGFLRISNFLSASTVVFILILNLMDNQVWTSSDPSQNILTCVQIVFLAFLTLVTCIDSIGTVSFCWREYGELSCMHTDATSCIFLLCSNRWIFRLGSGLLFLTSLSLPIMERLENQDVLPHTLLWVSALVCLCFVSAVVGFLLSLCVPTSRVPWLQGTFNPNLVHDDDDIWKRNKQDLKRDRSKEWRQRSQSHLCLWIVHHGIQILGMIFCLTAFVLAVSFHIVALIALTSNWPDTVVWKNCFLLLTIVVCVVLELTALGLLVVRVCKKTQSKDTWRRKSWIPIYIWIMAPHLLSCGVREFMEANLAQTLGLDPVQSRLQSHFEQFGLVFTWTNVMMPMVILGLFYFLIGVAVNANYVRAFWEVNFNSDRTGSRKVIRILDSMSTIFMLSSMIIGFTSLFIDQYDIAFSPEGVVKEVVEACEAFKEALEPVSTKLKKVIDNIDYNYSCKDVYNALGTTAAVGLFASFFPGAGSVASVSSRSAYYGVRTASALTNLAKRLNKSQATLWNVNKAVTKMIFFMGKNAKEIILASNSMDIGRLLPLLPPVILGLYVMFGVFWPGRVVFFTSKQRRSYMSTKFWRWTLALIVIIVAILINTVILDEVVDLFDRNIAVAKVQLKLNLGWKLAMTASALALMGTFFSWLIALIHMISTNRDHENLTNAEIDWRNELEKRELVTIRTALGNVYQKRTHLKYKRSRISPWTWFLPILFTLMACGFGSLANFYPKLKMIREPRGPFGRMIDKTYRKISLFEDDMYDVRNDTDMECLPLTTFNDVIDSDHHISDVLMNPVHNFYNLTNSVIRPLKETLSTFRKNIILEFGEDLTEMWEPGDLQYIGLIFSLPRLICLLILVFGCLMASIFKCSMRVICDSLQPRNIVDAYGKVAQFSIIYVVGSQLSLFNILQAFGVPFYHIYVKFGAGFVYDVVADSILLATYIGMNNEFFFAIPKRKTTVTYEVPGVSDSGPNAPGQII